MLPLKVTSLPPQLHLTLFISLVIVMVLNADHQLFYNTSIEINESTMLVDAEQFRVE